MKPLFWVILGLFFSVPASADEIVRITPDGSLGNVAFQNLAMNASGDYIAVSVANVFAGNANTNDYSTLFTGDRESFSLNHSNYFNVPTNDTNMDCDRYTRVQLDLDLQQVKAAINVQGDFILASVTKIFVGNVRTGEFRHVFTAPGNSSFQSVAINDSGHYLAASVRNIYGGHVAELSPSHLVDSSQGSLSFVSSTDSFQTIYVEVTAPRLALNASGKFLAITSSEVFSGSVPDTRVERLMSDASIGFRHLQLNDSGEFIITSKRNLFRGSID